jgi:hypothetical protein
MLTDLPGPIPVRRRATMVEITAKKIPAYREITFAVRLVLGLE